MDEVCETEPEPLEAPREPRWRGRRHGWVIDAIILTIIALAMWYFFRLPDDQRHLSAALGVTHGGAI